MVVQASNKKMLESFFLKVERRAFRMAELATRSKDDAMDILQDTMFKLVKNYHQKPAEEWHMLFFRILHNRIMDWHRLLEAIKHIAVGDQFNRTLPPVTVSIGIAEMQENEFADLLIGRARAALMRARERGGDYIST